MPVAEGSQKRKRHDTDAQESLQRTSRRRSHASQNGTDDGAPDNNGADTAEANSQLTSNAHFSPASEDPASGGAMPANSCSDSATIGIASALAILNGPERGSNATSYTADRGQPARARQEEQGGREDRGSGGAGDGVSSGGRGEGRVGSNSSVSRMPPPLPRSHSVASEEGRRGHSHWRTVQDAFMPLSSNGGQRAGEQMSLLMRVGSTGSFVLERAASHFNGAARRAVAVDRVCSDPRMRLDHLLGKLNFQFTKQEEAAIQRAFYCKDCKDTTTTCHQIRAVYDAFHLSWYGRGGQVEGSLDKEPERQMLSVADLGATVNKSEFGDEFYELLLESLRVLWDIQDHEKLFGAKEFILAFAHALSVIPNDRRVLVNRALGRMFGIEKTHYRFRLKKFLYAFLADNAAMVTHPLCLLHCLVARVKRKRDSPNSLFIAMSDATWLPPPYRHLEDFQLYLMRLWGPSLISCTLYWVNLSDMGGVSAVEPLCPLLLYNLIGLIVATVSAFEHRGLVMRRKYILTGESRQEDLRAIYAFGSHTPEGHAVERIGVIADVLCGSWFKPSSKALSWLMGFVHFLVPMLNRMYYDLSSNGAELADGGRVWKAGDALGRLSWEACTASKKQWLECRRAMGERVWYWLFGGSMWMHAAVTLPCSIISGYLVYRLMFITLDIFYNDLAFRHKLKLFRASTNSGYYLNYRRKWLHVVERDPALKARVTNWVDGAKDRYFMPLYSLQDKEDILLWCRIRQLLIESSAGFNNTQRDVIFTYMFFTLILLVSTLLFNNSALFSRQPEGHEGPGNPISVLDLWALLNSFIFSILLLGIMYLKLALYDLRRSDIRLLHTEYYRASLASSTPTESLSPHHRQGSMSATGAGAGRAQSLSRDSSMTTTGSGPGARMSNGTLNERISNGALSSFGGPTGEGALLPGNGTPRMLRAHSLDGEREGEAERDAGDGSLRRVGSGGGEGGSGSESHAGVLSGTGIHSAFGSGFNMADLRRGSSISSSRGRSSSSRGADAPHLYSWPQTDPALGDGGAQGMGFTKDPKTRELQELLEQTARYIQQFERPPTVIGYPVTWEVLRYISLSLIAAIFTGAKGTIFRSLSAQVLHASAPQVPGGAMARDYASYGSKGGDYSTYVRGAPHAAGGAAGAGGGGGRWF